MSDLLRIPYGKAALDGPAAEAEPAVTIDRGARTPLCLSDGPYPFPEPPDLVRAARVPERLALLREHLHSLCGLWDKPARAFLDAYFGWIGAEITESQVELTALAEATGGLFSPEDWSFAALRPLPQAYLSAIRVDFAFWTGAEIVAIELVGSATPRKKRRDELAQLRASGIVVMELPAGTLQDGRALAQFLTPQFGNFWTGITLPSSPFRPEGLGAILRPGSIFS